MHCTPFIWPRLTQNSAGNEVKANTAYTRAQECLFIVGNLNILKSPKIGRKGQVEFVLESLIRLHGRKAFKDFGTDEAPEKVSGVVFEDSEVARQNKLLTKGVRAKDSDAESDGEDLVDGVENLVISVNDQDQSGTTKTNDSKETSSPNGLAIIAG
jgi:hypothetical protein